MKKTTTRLIIAVAALVVAAGSAYSQPLTAEIPFAFRAGNQVLAPGTYRIDTVDRTNSPIFRLLNVSAHRATVLMPQAPVDPKKAWRSSGDPKLAFACGSGRCALAELWAGPGSYAYTFRHPKLGKDESAALMEIPMHRDKSE